MLIRKNWYLLVVWIVISAALCFGLLALERRQGAAAPTSTNEDSVNQGQTREKRSDDDRSRKDSNSDKKKSQREKKKHDQSDDAESQATVASISAAVSGIRGLPLLSKIEVSYLDRDELQKQIEDDFATEYPPAEIAAEEQALKALDLIGPDVDLLDAMQELLTDQIIGFYDDDTKQLALISDSKKLDLMNEVTLSHEVTHALQDQTFVLGSFYPLEGPALADANLARLALVEGDASLVMTEYVNEELTASELFGLGFSASGDAGSLMGAVPYLDDSLMFPYSAGESFVSYVKEKGDWQLVNAVYAYPPESTEQIIHPEKYFAGEHPVYVEIPDLLPIAGPGWELVYDDSFGEFDVRQLLSGNLRYRQSADAAAGWGGGRYSYYERADGAPMAVILLTWDSTEEADEFVSSMAGYLEASYCSWFEFNERQFPILESCDGDYWVMVRKGTAVLVARVPDRTLANLLPARILNVEPPEPSVLDDAETGNVVTAIGESSRSS